MKLPAVTSNHQNGESSLDQKNNNLLSENSALAVDTFGGRVHVEWDPHSATTPLGQLPFTMKIPSLMCLLINRNPIT